MSCDCRRTGSGCHVIVGVQEEGVMLIVGVQEVGVM